MSETPSVSSKPLYCWSRNSNGWTVRVSYDKGLTWDFVRCVVDPPAEVREVPSGF